ncbi:FixH family protein [Paenibacillus protaetiae]|uniref:FixH family protein n=1 Tax=Paenibacillus protaetiae TaxID=2509456 RepID=UPI0013EBDC32|nr:FixH family protein [Paenibacillus protaetiae]
MKRSPKTAVYAAAAVLAAAALIFAAMYTGIFKAKPPAASPPTEWSAGGISAEISTGDQPVKALQTGQMTVMLHGLDGRPLEHAELILSIDMLEMKHRLKPVPMAEIAPGEYTADFVPVMNGKWSADVKITYNGETQEAAHPFTVFR